MTLELYSNILLSADPSQFSTDAGGCIVGRILCIVCFRSRRQLDELIPGISAGVFLGISPTLDNAWPSFPLSFRVVWNSNILCFVTI